MDRPGRSFNQLLGTLSPDTRKLVALKKKIGALDTVRHEDIFKDPYVLDFCGLKGAYSEKDLEAAIIRNLEQSFSELGSDFCFIGRQHPMRIDDTDYFPACSSSVAVCSTNRVPSWSTNGQILSSSETERSVAASRRTPC